MPAYVVCAIKPWNIDAFHTLSPFLPGEWHLIEKPEDLPKLYEIMPRYVFFPHWSWKVPTQILKDFECVGFHMTDLPYGRGGSPLQNLILRGHKDTKLSALRLTEEMDAGPIYAKQPLTLEGCAYDIYCRSTALSWAMMHEIITKEPTPVEQTGGGVVFHRLAAGETDVTAARTAEEMYDHIRMIDAPTYPKASHESSQWRFEFDSASLVDEDTVEARVTIKRLS